MKISAHHIAIAQLGAMVAFFTASGCGLLLGGYGDDPPSGTSGMGGQAGAGGTSGMSSVSSSGGGMEGPGGGGAGGGGVGGAGGSGDVCNATEINVAPGPSELLLLRSTADKKSALTPTLSSQCAQGTSGPEDVFVVNVKANGILTAMVTAAKTNFDSVLYARKGDCSSSAAEVCADRTSGTHDLHGGELLSFPVKTGEKWYIVVDGYNDMAKGDYELRASLRTGANQTSVVPVRFELGSPMTLHGAIDSNSDVYTFTCGGLGEVIYRVEYGTGVARVKFTAIPAAPNMDLSLYGTKSAPDGIVTTEGACQSAGCDNSPFLHTSVGTPYMVVDGSLPGGSTCVSATHGPYQLLAEPLAQ